MKPDELEPRLERIPFRTVPPAWKADILRAAEESSVRRSAPSPRWRLFGAASWARNAADWLVRELFGWNPQAWTGLAVVWIVIIALNLAAGGEDFRVGKKLELSPELSLELEQQRKLFATWMGEPQGGGDVAPPKRLPLRPRSERSAEIRSV